MASTARPGGSGTISGPETICTFSSGRLPAQITNFEVYCSIVSRRSAYDADSRPPVADGSKVTLDDVDYLVVAFEHRATLIDDSFGQVSLLPFHADFDALKKSISGRAPGIEDAYRKLVASIVSSPDLIESDRFALIGAYQSRAEQLYRQTAQGTIFKGEDNTDFGTVLMELEGQKRNEDISPLLRSVRGAIASAPDSEESKNLAANGDVLSHVARNILGSKAMKEADALAISRASSRMFAAALQAPFGE